MSGAPRARIVAAALLLAAGAAQGGPTHPRAADVPVLPPHAPPHAPPDAPPDAPDPHRFWSPAVRPGQIALEAELNAVPAPANLRGWHDRFACEPHLAGTAGDARTIERLVASFESMGLAVERHDVWVYLAEPGPAQLEIVAPERVTLALRERPLPSDPDTAHPDLTDGFNAYSGSGDVTAEVVYANYGQREDFEQLRASGVDIAGKIVIARYGGNFRGFKARFAEAAGAAGLIIYTDPADSGYAKGVPWPEGGYANETLIQRGSIGTSPYAGDPLTPFREATEDAPRLDPGEADLPTIPVQPVGWGAAQEIMSRMTGRPLPEPLVSRWQGGLPFAYRLEGGPGLRVHLAVRQERRILRTSNVIATLPGRAIPEERVILGCHHDAWGFGASDPLAGLIVLMESARSFAEAASRGHGPDRSVLFAAWGAEEYGIIGSTEWCEAHRDELARSAVAYVNLDMAAMGTQFGSSAAPALGPLIREATRAVPVPGGTAGAPAAGDATVFDAWVGGDDAGAIGNLGGGSDHVAFYCHLGVPACGLGGHGGRGTAYHSNYDTLAWYRHVVGDDYAAALMVTRVTNLVAARLAGATLLPLDPVQVAGEARGHLDALAEKANARGLAADLAPLRDAIDGYERRMTPTWAGIQTALARDRLSADALARINGVLLTLERRWLAPEGLPGRPWFRNLYAATDPNSGYAAWMLPALRGAIEEGSREAFDEALAAYLAVFEDLDRAERELRHALGRRASGW